MSSLELAPPALDDAPTSRPHVVFVDDEAMALAALGNRLRKLRGRWDIAYCTSGEQALEQIRQRPATIVVADLGMPVMDGHELLRRVKEASPRTVRVALSGQIAAEAATRALSVAHQYLPKPCDTDRIVQIVERAERLPRSFSPDVVALVASTPTLPPAPRTYAKLTSILMLERWSLDDVTRIVEADAILTAKLVQVVASPFFGFRRAIASVREAVRVLGAGLVQRLALGLEATHDLPPIPFDVLDVEGHAAHARHVAACAAELAPPEQAMDAYVAGLVHDLGRIVLAIALPEVARALRAEAGDDEEAHLGLERERLGFTHAEVGAALLALWGLPPDVVAAVCAHHDVSSDGLGGILAAAEREAMAANTHPSGTT